MRNEVAEKDTALYDFVDAMNAIEENLAAIKEKEGIIVVNKKGVSVPDDRFKLK